MRTILMGMVFLYATASGACMQPNHSENEVRTAVLDFAENFSTGKFANIESTTAKTYMHINSGNSPLTRTQWLGWYRGFADDITKGDHIFENYQIENLQIAFYEDAAYVTGVVNANGTRLGEPFTQSIRFTNLWVVEGEHWKRAGFQDAPSTQ